MISIEAAKKAAQIENVTFEFIQKKPIPFLGNWILDKSSVRELRRSEAI